MVFKLYIITFQASRRNVLTSIGLRAPQSPVDFLFILFFIASIVVNGFRAAVSLLPRHVIGTVKPVLTEP